MLSPPFCWTAGPLLRPRIAQASFEARRCRAAGLDCRRYLIGFCGKAYFLHLHTVVNCDQKEQPTNGEGQEPISQTQKDSPSVNGKDYYASDQGKKQNAGQSQLPDLNNLISFGHYDLPNVKAIMTLEGT